MRRLLVSEWVTLDGIYDADSMPQWEIPYNSDDKWNFIKDGILSCDIMLVGRVTYEMFAAYWPTQKNNEMGVADKMKNVAKYVVSKTLKKAEWNNSTIISDNVIEEITRLKQQPGGDIRISGSATLVESLMETGLIDEYEFFVHPIIMGEGKRFFKEDMPITKLELIETKTFRLGVTVLRYRNIGN